MPYVLRKNLLLFCVSLLISVLIATPCLAGRSSDGIYNITIDLVSSSGGTIIDSNYQIQTSIGQPVQGNTFSTTRAIQGGFWFTVNPLPEKKKSNIFLLIIPVITSQTGK